MARSSRVRRGRRLLAVVAVAAGILSLVVVAGLPLYVFPPAEPVRQADVIMVLGPPLDERVELAEQLRDEGWADEILISVAAPGEPASDLGVCHADGVTCQTPQPFTTAGEAAMLDAYADAHDVDHALVLTFTPHIARTRHIFEVCADTDTTVVEVPAQLGLTGWAWQYAYQTGAFAKAFLLPCD